MKKGCLIGLVIAGVLLIIVLGFFGYVRNTYNQMVTLEESVNGSWSQVQNVYQRRYDLIPNLVETVKGYAKHEQETFQNVAEARSKVGGQINLQAKDLTAENLAKFQQAQAGLSSALQRLMVVVERYPDLKANQNFIRLQDELAGTENRIAQERRRFNEATRMYNTYIRQFPATIIANMSGFTAKPYFEADAQAQEAPRVEF